MTDPWNVEESPERDRSRAAVRALNQREGQLRAQKNLTREGRQSRMAKARQETQAAQDALGDAETKRIYARRDQLIKRVHGYTNPDATQIISIRDAQDRVAKVENAKDMAALMNLADRNGDTVLLRAAAQECAARSTSPLGGAHYAPLFHTWVETQPHGPEVVQELADIDHELTDPTARLLRERAFSAGALPDELRGKSNTQINELARQADAIPELPPSQAQQVGDKLATWVRGHTELDE